jgi:hypothetical protein
MMAFIGAVWPASTLARHVLSQPSVSKHLRVALLTILTTGKTLLMMAQLSETALKDFMPKIPWLLRGLFVPNATALVQLAKMESPAWLASLLKGLFWKAASVLRSVREGLQKFQILVFAKIAIQLASLALIWKKMGAWHATKTESWTQSHPNALKSVPVVISWQLNGTGRMNKRFALLASFPASPARFQKRTVEPVSKVTTLTILWPLANLKVLFVQKTVFLVSIKQPVIHARRDSPKTQGLSNARLMLKTAQTTATSAMNLETVLDALLGTFWMIENALSLVLRGWWRAKIWSAKSVRQASAKNAT